MSKPACGSRVPVKTHLAATPRLPSSAPYTTHSAVPAASAGTAPCVRHREHGSSIYTLSSCAGAPLQLGLASNPWCNALSTLKHISMMETCT